MKKIGFIPNILRDKNLETTKRLLRFVGSMGCASYVTDEVYRLLGDGCGATVSERPEKDADFLLVLGGDGTLLHAAKTAAIYNVPIIGVNVGHLGYLTDTDKDGAEAALERVLRGDCKFEKRMMLEAEIAGYNSKTPLIALNDICVTRGAHIMQLDCELSINGQYIDTYSADGVIVCTPTGSTAYNLSAGGPILRPDSEMMAITPICPHTLYARSSVMSSEDVIVIRTPESVTGNILISLDGRNIDGKDIVTGGSGGQITVRRSQFYTTVIKTNSLGFYDILRQKLMGK